MCPPLGLTERKCYSVHITGQGATKIYEVKSTVSKEGYVEPDIICVQTIVNDSLYTPSLPDDNVDMECLACPLSGDIDEIINMIDSINLETCSVDSLLPLLMYYWSFDNLRPLQRKSIDKILQGKHVFVSIQTGGGKTLI